MLAALAAVLGLVGVLAVVDQQSQPDEEVAAEPDATTTTERRPATTGRRNPPTTPTVRTFESTILLPPGVRLLGWTGSNRADVLDPATGLITETDLAVGDFGRVVPRLDGAVVASNERSQIMWYPQLPVAANPTVLASDSFDIFPSDIADRVWIGSWVDTASFSEVDLRTGEVLAETALPSGAYAVGAIAGGLVIQAPDGLYADRRGADRYEWIVNGQYVASLGQLLAYRSCDEFLRCPISVRDLDDGREVEMDMIGDETGAPFVYVHTAVFDPGGRWLVIAGDDPTRGARLEVYDAATGRLVLEYNGVTATQVAWTPDGEWLLWPDGSMIQAFRPADRATAVIDTGGTVYRGVAVLAPPGPAAG